MRYCDRWWVSVAVVGLAVASACGDGPVHCGDCPLTVFQAVAAGNNVAVHKNPADSAARAVFTIDGTHGTRAFSFTYSLGVAPHGTVDRILVLQDTVPKGTICSAAPCPASGTVAGVTDTALYRAMRNVQARVVVITDTDPAGAMSGAIVPTIIPE